MSDDVYAVHRVGVDGLPVDLDIVLAEVFDILLVRTLPAAELRGYTHILSELLEKVGVQLVDVLVLGIAELLPFGSIALAYP